MTRFSNSLSKKKSSGVDRVIIVDSFHEFVVHFGLSGADRVMFVDSFLDLLSDLLVWGRPRDNP